VLVVDTSAILAVLFNEPQANWAAGQLQKQTGKLMMSTVNLAEALIIFRSRQPVLAEQLESTLCDGSIQFIAPTVDQVRIVADARLRLPLNLGDCFAYALAVTEQCELLAVDADFGKVDIPVVIP
jgi:ribonuclease VapC